MNDELRVSSLDNCGIFLELMEKKTVALEKILGITKATVFSGEVGSAEADAEAFAILYERRENILKRVEKADAAMKELDLLEDVSDDFPKRFAVMKAKQRDIAEQLLALDKANMKAYDIIKAHLQGGLKTVRQTRDVNEKYLDGYDDTEGYYFDKKN